MAPTPTNPTGPTTTVAMLYPGYAAEDDFPRLEKTIGSTVALPVVHTAGDDVEHTVDALLAVGSPDELARGAADAAHHQPDAIVWACTSGSFVYGWHGAQTQATRLAKAAGVPATSTSLAFARAASALGLRRLAVAATYPDDLAEHFRRFLSDAGFEVLRFSAAGIFTAAEVGTLGDSEVLELAAAHDHPDAEAVLLPDTALHTIAALPDLEARLGKPVLTANQVSAWEGLQLAGFGQPQAGLGALFERGGTPE